MPWNGDWNSVYQPSRYASPYDWKIYVNRWFAYYGGFFPIVVATCVAESWSESRQQCLYDHCGDWSNDLGSYRSFGFGQVQTAFFPGNYQKGAHDAGVVLPPVCYVTPPADTPHDEQITHAEAVKRGFYGGQYDSDTGLYYGGLCDNPDFSMAVTILTINQLWSAATSETDVDPWVSYDPIDIRWYNFTKLYVGAYISNEDLTRRFRIWKQWYPITKDVTRLPTDAELGGGRVWTPIQN